MRKRLETLANLERTLTPAELGELCSLRVRKLPLEEGRQLPCALLLPDIGLNVPAKRTYIAGNDPVAADACTPTKKSLLPYALRQRQRNLHTTA
jgi:hypothetical protein